MTQPLVSVIIPAFNSSKFIASTIKSVLQQSYSRIEIIVIDDGSTDNTAKILKKLNSKKTRYFYQKNKGLSFSRNRGLQLAQGKYIAFMDHDDFWYPDKIEKQLDIFRKKRKVGLVYTDGFITNLQGKVYQRFFSLQKPYKGKVTIDLINGNVIPWSSVMIRHNILAPFPPFRKQLYIAEDYDFLLRVSLKTEFDYVDKPLIRYQRHETNLSKKEHRSLEEKLWVLENFLKGSSSDNIKRIAERRLAEIYLEYCLVLLVAGNIRIFKISFGKLLNKKPDFFHLLITTLAIIKGKIVNLTGAK